MSLRFFCGEYLRDPEPLMFSMNSNELGYPFFPTLDGWYAKLDRLGGGHPVLFFYEDFLEYMSIPAPEGSTIYGDYLQAFARSVRNEGIKISVHNWKEVLDYYWQVERFPTPLRCEHLSIPATVEDDAGNEFDEWIEENDRTLLVYTREPVDTLWFELPDDFVFYGDLLHAEGR